MATNDFLTFAGDPAANVMPQNQFADVGFIPRILGFSSGTAISTELNKVWRQASLIAHVVGQFSVDWSLTDMLDDATPAGLTALQANFTTAVRNVALNTIGVGYLPLTGGSLSGPLTINSTTLAINAPSGQNASISVSRGAGHYGVINASTGAQQRWQIQVPNADAEQGSDTGSNFAIASFHDGGQPIEVPLSINRATGVVNFSRNPTVNGANLPYVRLSGGDVMTGTLGVGGHGISYNGLSSYWAAHRIAFGYDNTSINVAVDGNNMGALALQSWVNTVASGYVLKSGDTMSGYLTVNAGAAVNGALTCGGTVSFAGLSDFYNAYGGARYRFRQWASNHYDYWDAQTGVRGWAQNGKVMTLDLSANLAMGGNMTASGGRVISVSGVTQPSVCAYWTGGVATGFWSDSEGQSFGNMDGAGNPSARHMLIGNDGYLTLWGSTSITGSVWVGANVTATLDIAARHLFASYDINAGRNIWANSGAVTGGYMHALGGMDIDLDLVVHRHQSISYDLTVGRTLTVNSNIWAAAIATNDLRSYGDLNVSGTVWGVGSLVTYNGDVYAHYNQNGPVLASVGVQYRPLGPHHIGFQWNASQKLYAWIDGTMLHLISGPLTGDDRVNALGLTGGSYMYCQDNDGSLWYLNIFRSDARLKKNIRPAPEFDSLAAIVATPLHSFEWLNDDDPPVTHGFLASDLRETMPDVVRALRAREDGPDTVDYVEVLPMLAHCFRAIRQLSDEIAALKESRHV